MLSFFFFFNDTATTEIYTLSLHDALPIYGMPVCSTNKMPLRAASSLTASLRAPPLAEGTKAGIRDRKSTRLNSSHGYISYAVFCLKKKKQMSAIAHHIRTYKDNTTLT